MTFAPPDARYVMAELQRRTGVAPTGHLVDARRYRITHANARVRMTYDLKKIRPGRWDNDRSTLTIDGRPQPLADDFDDYVRIFADPDAPRGEQTPPEPAPPVRDPMPPAADVTTAPAEIRNFYELMAQRLGDRGTVLVGYADGRWWLGLDLSADTWSRLRFKPTRGTWGLDGFQVVVDGVDRGAETGGQIQHALALLFGGNPDADAPPAAAGPVRRQVASPRASTGVQVRKTTVIRT